MRYLLTILAFTATILAVANAKEITDAECASIIAKESRDAYYQTGRPCACPDDRARDGTRCGGRSTRKKPPYCDPLDVPQTDIDRCKAIHNKGAAAQVPGPALRITW